ncbi:MAG: hypothetical protein UU48_C0006G0061 [Candidatus Uhrbacteria bacterium GW2011_GWF2_41_16]|uniref:DZANK-type domain-containing protein n=2 Tax=Candidatus Uhriibacteriota TaxID=1752732 RepID=A0A0G0VEB2_9BACT|nr:MAG: hypothetical protein UU35_C0007G0072 [Candidatus Uhrbacteria bacterium GW2011_GWC2_41_11]KKR98021.1 MAG: hypothetical protein UU48_C0006G0061 [Candidatus Uhrbacteria bacterium GW2011_GWF2_41_16]
MTLSPMTSDTFSKKPEWWRKCVYLAILYRIAEFGEKMEIIHLNHEDGQFVEPILMQMNRDALLDLASDGLHWTITTQGREFLKKMVELTDRLLPFEIFNGVRMQRRLENHEHGDNPNFVYDDIYDPRFVKHGENDPTATDMRIAMIEFMGMMHPDGAVEIDPNLVVFIQKLVDREFRGNDFWFKLRVGTFFKQIEEIVQSAYRIEDLLHPPMNLNQDAATLIMQDLYTAGMIEQQKRDGTQCSHCGITLAIFEQEARKNGGELTYCPNPNCEASFEPPPVPSTEYECPNCGSGVSRNQRKCRGCGAYLNFGLFKGTVQENTVYKTVTEAVETPVWGYGYEYYGYSPIGYYDPWNPVDVFVTAALLSAIF